MVNKKRVKRKLPMLLVDGPLSDRDNFNQYQLKRYRLYRVEKKNKSILNRYLKRIVRALEEFEEAMENTDFEF